MSLSFTFIDLLVLGVVVVSAFYAGYRGLVSETLTMFAWVAAALATLWFGPTVVPFAKSLVASPLFAPIIAYAAVFLAVLIPLSFLSFRLSQQVKSSQVGTLDRALGAAFGVIRGLAIIGFAYLILSSFVKFDSQPESVRNARTLPLMQASTEVILSLVPSRHEHVAKNPSGNASDDSQVSDDSGVPAMNVDVVPKPKPGARDAKATKKPKKTYGAQDRRALDNLIETTGGNSTP
jgi:uncharacterized membrane protein required for colicin V production